MISRLMKNASQSARVPRRNGAARICRTGEWPSTASSMRRPWQPTGNTPMRRTMASALLSAGLRRARKRTDSGSANHNTGSNASGSTPPRASTLRQPKTGNNCAATTPPKAEPRVKPQNMPVTIKERRRCGQYSDVRVMALGIAPPRPRPVSRRNSARLCRSWANAAARLKTPKQATDSNSTRLRPKRSAKGPAMNAPSISPTSAAPSTGPSSAAPICQCSRSAGAMKPMAAVSRPSMAVTRKHSSKTRH
ncbi:hypothetical protein D9M71_443830 [compost metagenome]